MEWDSARVEEILTQMRARRGDSTSVEVKRATGGVAQLADTLCAFANMPGGGTVILGVDEAGGKFNVTGVPDTASFEAGLTTMAREAVRPSPQIVFHSVGIDGKPVLIAEVFSLPLEDKPARIGDTADLRQADGDYPMNPYEIRCWK